MCRSGRFADDRNNFPLPGIEPRSVQPLAYTDYTIPAPLQLITPQFNKILSSDVVKITKLENVIITIQYFELGCFLL
jgi:hypothetical protein